MPKNGIICKPQQDLCYQVS